MKFILFTDDTNILYLINNYLSINTDLNDKLINVSYWFNCNRLSLNAEKSNLIHFHSKKSQRHSNISEQLKISMNDKIIKRVRTVKFLGIFINENMSWTDHIMYIKNKVSKGVGIVGKLRTVLPQNILRLLYNTFILPFLTYCNAVWANTYKSKLHSLFLLQKKAVRICSLNSYYAHSRPLFISLNILDIYQLNRYCISISLFKHKN